MRPHDGQVGVAAEVDQPLLRQQARQRLDGDVHVGVVLPVAGEGLGERDCVLPRCPRSGCRPSALPPAPTARRRRSGRPSAAGLAGWPRGRRTPGRASTPPWRRPRPRRRGGRVRGGRRGGARRRGMRRGEPRRGRRSPAGGCARDRVPATRAPAGGRTQESWMRSVLGSTISKISLTGTSGAAFSTTARARSSSCCPCSRRGAEEFGKASMPCSLHAPDTGPEALTRVRVRPSIRACSAAQRRAHPLKTDSATPTTTAPSWLRVHVLLPSRGLPPASWPPGAASRAQRVASVGPMARVRVVGGPGVRSPRGP